MEKVKASVSEIRESFNPVFKTARTCVTVNAMPGDKDPQKLIGALGFNLPVLNPDGGKMTPEMREFAAQMSNPGFNIMVETRFAATNKFILDSGISQVVDIPCGYTPRGVKLADTGIQYFGLDIPAVTEEIAPAVKNVIGENQFIRWVMTAKEHPSEKADEEDVLFSVKSDMSDGHLYLAISGRLDTLTAPELLSLYQEKGLKGDIKSISIDAASLTYISSAGLRVFLIMRKDLREKDQFQIRNIRKSVKEILNITGFSSLFIYDDNEIIS